MEAVGCLLGLIQSTGPGQGRINVRTWVKPLSDVLMVVFPGCVDSLLCFDSLILSNSPPEEPSGPR